MAESVVKVSEGSGKLVHSFSRIIGSSFVDDISTIDGMPYYASYSVGSGGATVAVANDHAFQIRAGASLIVYVHELTVVQHAPATTAAFMQWEVWRTTTAGTGGFVTGQDKLDTTDSSASVAFMQNPTAKGTESVRLDSYAAYVTQTPGVAGFQWPVLYRFKADGKLLKPWRIPAGTTNCIVLKNVTAMAGAQVDARLVWSEASF